MEINIVQENVIAHDRRYGTETKYLQLELIKPYKTRAFDDVAKKKDVAFYLEQKTGLVIAVTPKPITEEEQEAGSTEQMYYVHTTSPNLYRKPLSERVLKNLTFDQRKGYASKYTPLSIDDARKLWNKQIKGLPKTRKETKHMITGVLLPVWNYL